MRRQPMCSPMRRRRGFTLVEVAIGAALFGVVVFLGIMVYRALRSETVISGTFTTTTPEIVLSEGGGDGRFVFTMKRTVSGQPSAAIPNRKIDLAVTPKTGALIASVTDAIGSARFVNQDSTSLGATDATGNVTIEVHATAAGQYSLKATDVASSSAETTTFEVKAP
jgi:prepilin-type N-terminal cleavage/methylation domain-containing protein